MHFSELTRKKCCPLPVIRKDHSDLNTLRIQYGNIDKPGITTAVRPLSLAKILTHIQIDLQGDIQFHDRLHGPGHHGRS